MLTNERTVFRPIQYPWAYEAFEKQSKIHWIKDEVDLSRDVGDWRNGLSASEKNLLTQLFRFFVTADVDVGRAYLEKYCVYFKPPEVRMMMSTFAAMEAIHIDSYDALLQTVNMPDVEYQAFQAYSEMADKHEYLWENPIGLTEKQKIAFDVAKFSAFAEGLQLFSSFVILLSFQNRGLMKGMGQIVTFSVRDEDLHCSSMIKLFKTFRDENPEIWDDNLKRAIYECARQMVQLEENFVDLCFAMGDIEGITKDEVMRFVRWLCDKRLVQLGLKPNYDETTVNPIPWLDDVLQLPDFVNFFEQNGTEYTKVGTTGSASDLTF
ncbi:MAG: ribonucleotide-diphosphate reductase subunit beta [Ekhidna sp.]|nr:ribonucleotide-diphosphate reductase subunit beta [Ekhidna sp.]